VTGNDGDTPDLPAIAHEADLELVAAEELQAAYATTDDVRGSGTAELGYYEAELRSLRDAATTLEGPEESL
jgi:hypothetical protein